MKEMMTKRALQKEQTSKAILSASLSVFANSGYNASFSDISKIAGVTNGLIVQRFGSKEALYLQLLNDVISSFPTFEKALEINDGLLEIISFVKNLAIDSKVKLEFCETSFNSYESLPDSCKDAITKLFISTQLNKIFDREISEGKITNRDALDVFLRFVHNCCELTIKFLKNNAELPTNEIYLQLFKKLDSLDETKFGLTNESSVFENISDQSLKLYNVITWYAEIAEDREPALYFPKAILHRIGINEDATPEYVYNFIVNHVDTEDAPLVREAIHKMYLGQYVEFEYRWSSPYAKTSCYRCSGKRTKVENGVTRFEGILQNISSFASLRNHKQTRKFLLNLIAQDYEYVSYVHLGNTADDDFVEDYKSSEFFNKLTENWEHNNNFTDRFTIVLNKILTSVDRERFTKGNNRQIILDNLKKSDIFKTSFKVRHFGVVYHYEVAFFADRGDDNNISGIICGIRLVNNSLTNIRVSAENETNFDKELTNMLLSDSELAFLVNLKDHTFEVRKTSNHFNDRNSYLPDFEAFMHAYIKRDVYFEDIEKMIDATTIVNIRARLESSSVFAITYRDISRETPTHYIMRFTKGENNHVCVLMTNVHQYFLESNKNVEVLEDTIRSKNQEILDQNNLLNNINTTIVDLLGSIVESRRENNIKQDYKFKYLTYIFAHQLMQDYPELGLTGDLVSSISEASVLHDIGKLSVPDEILYKNGKLNTEELKTAKSHAENSRELLSKLRNIYDNSYYQILCSVCENHHERWNGEGYPNGLSKSDIPLEAQIVGLVDAFHALVSKRPYREAYDYNTAINMIINGECGSFNPIFFKSLKNCAEHLINYMEHGTANENKIVNQTAGSKIYKFNTVINNQTLPAIARLSEQMPGGFFVYKKDSQSTLLFFNNMMIKYFNCPSREEFIKYVNNSFKGIVHKDDFDKANKIIEKQFSATKNDLNSAKYRIVCKNGQEKILSHYGYVTHTEAFGDVCYAFVQDVTQYEKAAQASLQSVIQSASSRQIVNPVSSSSSRVKTLDGTRILIVDDNDLSRFMTKDTLEEEGANVTDFSTGAAALDAIQKVKPFDIILVDLVMPEMNGVELTRLIREWEEDKDIRVPIVAVTGEVDSDLAKECIKAGANGCMSKPLAIAALARILILSMKEHSIKIESKLTSTIKKANTDALTHVKNRTAYAEKIEQLSAILRNDPYYEFGIVGADINNLKIANDQFGHDTGDMYIKNCCKMLCDVFLHSPVYRTGGDEFSIILEGEDLANWKELMAALDNENKIRSALTEYEKGKAHIAMGAAVYDPTIDMTVDDVIKRADTVMYENKQFEKARVAGSFKF